MSSLTLRNIPDNILKQIRTLSEKERRSINNEIIVLLEEGLNNHIMTMVTYPKDSIPKNIQTSLWETLCGSWDDERSTKEIIDDIYQSRTMGREFSW